MDRYVGTGTCSLGTLPCSSESVWSEGAYGLRTLGGVTQPGSGRGESINTYQ